VSLMTQQRHEEILRILNERGTVSVTDLTEALGSSESTIRRDLLALDKLGKLTKVHGGATKSDHQFLHYEADFEEKIQTNVEEKKRIAAYCAQQIQETDFVYLDAGTTTLLMIDFITAMGAQFITNGLSHARELARRGFDVAMLGGEVKAATDAVVGVAAARNLESYNFSKAFIGTNGVDVKRGFSTPDPDEAFVKKTAIDRAFVSYVLADSSKFGKVSSVTFSSLEHSAVVTDTRPAEVYEEQTVIKVVD